MITVYLIIAGIPAIREIGLVDFLFGKVWASTNQDAKFGILPFILTSVYGTAGAILIGVPVGFFFLRRFIWRREAPPKLRGIVEEAVNLFGRHSVRRLRLGRHVDPGAGHPKHLPCTGWLQLAGCHHCIGDHDFCRPSSKVSITGLEAVPKEYEDASLALERRRRETWFKVSVPAARSGIAAAVVLGVGRAIGEAMAVMMVSGNVANMPHLFESVRFLTTAVASEMSYAGAGLQRQALFSIALVLFLFIMLINATLNFFLKRSKER